MSTLSIQLPDSVLFSIAQRAERCGFTDVGEFVAQLIVQMSERLTNVETLALEGLRSGPSEPWRKEEIDSIRDHLKIKYGAVE